MKREIFIIHPSEIVRKGLSAILRSYFNLEITPLKSTAELASFGEAGNTHFIVFAGPAGENDMKTMLRPRQGNRMSVIRVGLADGSGLPPAGADHHLAPDASGEDIRVLVSGLINEEQGGSEYKTADGELTVREKDVLRLVALGHSNKEIADKLFISIHTVISHRKNITEKLGIKSISGLTVYAILNRIIDTDLINADQLI